MDEPFDLTIRGATVVSSEGQRRLDVAIRNGVIAEVAPPRQIQAGLDDVDARGLLLLPGIVDTHFHCRSPDHPEREDFDSGTAAAVSGGVTTIVEMPIADVACSTPERLASRMELAAQQGRIDVGFYGAVGLPDRQYVQELRAAGALAFKVMMHSAPPGRELSFEGLAITDDQHLFRALEAVAEIDELLVVHAEHQGLIDLFESRIQYTQRNDPLAHLASRPDVAESSAIARIASMNEHVGARIHIAHLSSQRGLDMIRWYQGRGQRITAETTPAYLYMNEEDVERYGPYVKVNPPLRSKTDQHALREGLIDDAIDLVISDHAPFLAHEKEPGWSNIWQVGSGIPGVELTGRLLWDDALRGGFSLESVVRWTSERPAGLFGLAPKKGFIRVGADADLVLLDPMAQTTLSRDRFHSRSRDAIRHVDGKTCQGDIVTVWSRGRRAFKDGSVLVEPGSGAVLTGSHHAS